MVLVGVGVVVLPVGLPEDQVRVLLVVVLIVEVLGQEETDVYRRGNEGAAFVFDV